MEKKERILVYVQAPDGKPLMPTARLGWVRRAVRSGKAKPVSNNPFTIRLQHEPETMETQEVYLGLDGGRTNIGLCAVSKKGEVLYSGQCETCNKNVPRRMEKRKQCRQASRAGERAIIRRRAIRNGTVFKDGDEREITLPGCEKPITCKFVKNSEAKFNNRSKPEGWLTPTALQLLLTHINLVRKIMDILPVSAIVLEINKFAFMALENPGIRRWQYQKGPLQGKGSAREAVAELQQNHCLLCKGKIEHYHHIVPKRENGSDTLGNLAGLCGKHHDLAHRDAATVERLRKKKAGGKKKFNALSVLNQIIPFLVEKLNAICNGNLYVTDGQSTWEFRKAHKIRKDHHTDAYCVACSVLDEPKANAPEGYYQIGQYRRHDRAETKAWKSRKYKMDIGKGKPKVVAVNRNKACVSDPAKGKSLAQKTDSLAEWRQKQIMSVGEMEARKMESRLIAVKSARTYNTWGRYLPGSIFMFEGKRHVLSANHGEYVHAYGHDARDFPRRDIIFVARNCGLVYLGRKKCAPPAPKEVGFRALEV